ncbi:hypothetical protein [Nonomuraea sp. NPDC050643]|uniref:hypothetical protein n=1 Tax=Nonomuraea sp. NPDC050643 TaxID=3155660 RepID=UPI0033E6AE04
MKLLMKAFVAGSALACMAVVGAAGTAHAATGRLTLISGTASATVTYDSCQPPRQYQSNLFQLDAFDNQPAPGCQAVLISRAGASKVLCVGRGNVPAEFRDARLVQFRPGTAPNCGFETNSAG